MSAVQGETSITDKPPSNIALSVGMLGGVQKIRLYVINYLYHRKFA